VLVDLDAEAVELHLMKPAIPYRRLFPICRSARRNEDWMQHSGGYTKRLKTTSMDLEGGTRRCGRVRRGGEGDMGVRGSPRIRGLGSANSPAPGLGLQPIDKRKAVFPWSSARREISAKLGKRQSVGRAKPNFETGAFPPPRGWSAGPRGPNPDTKGLDIARVTSAAIELAPLLVSLN
jgi:hypothetical protein